MAASKICRLERVITSPGRVEPPLVSLLYMCTVQQEERVGRVCRATGNHNRQPKIKRRTPPKSQTHAERAAKLTLGQQLAIAHSIAQTHARCQAAKMPRIAVTHLTTQGEPTLHIAHLFDADAEKRIVTVAFTVVRWQDTGHYFIGFGYTVHRGPHGQWVRKWHEATAIARRYSQATCKRWVYAESREWIPTLEFYGALRAQVKANPLGDAKNIHLPEQLKTRPLE